MGQVDMEACMAAGQPGEQHGLLGQFEGTWKATVRMFMEPGAPPMESTGVMKNTWALGKRFIRHDFQGDDGQFTGEGYFGFNKMSGEYEGIWLDTMTTCISMDTGACDASGKVWRMSGKAQMPGMGEFTRSSVTTVHGPDTHVMEMFMKGPDGNEAKIMEIEYNRA